MRNKVIDAYIHIIWQFINWPIIIDNSSG